MTRIDPERPVLGSVNQNSYFGPEFTFHHGHVERVLSTQEDLDSIGYPGYGVPSDLSQCILITPTFAGHGSDSFTLPTNSLKGMVLAQPLMRGFADSITHGDAVIYTNLGTLFFYLGPINTTNDPNKTPDHLHHPDLNPNRLIVDDGADDNDGYPVNYISRTIDKAKKIRNILLDRPYDTGIGEIDSVADHLGYYSDLQLEGRQGNSIQMGARFINPYITIKNNNTNVNNGSVLGMLSLGTISDYFPSFDINGNLIGYKLSADKRQEEEMESETGYIGYKTGIGSELFNSDFGTVENEAEHQVDFDQIIMFSDRITFDAQKNDLTMSARRNINFGAGRNFTITNKGFSVIESKNIYIGKEAKNKTEPIVLGDKLRDILLDIMKLINDSRALVQGVPIPLVDQSSKLLSGPQSRIQKLIDELEPRTYEKDENGKDIKTKPKIENEKGKDTRFFSQQHYIEINRS